MENTNEEEKIETEAKEEAELDKSLEESIESVKAGNALHKEDVTKAEEKKVETPEAPKSEENSTPPVEEAKSEEDNLEKTNTEGGEKEGYEFRIPNKGKFESDESFEKRVHLLDLVKRRKLAKTEEQRQQLSDEIKTTKGQIKNLNGTDRFINPLNQTGGEKTELPKEDTDEALVADRERLKQLGGATKEDIAEIVQQERLANDVRNTINSFVDRYSEMGDEDTREVFFDFVDSNYNWQNKGGKDLMTVLELARESMFKPSETIQERVLAGANVQEKVNAMQFPGGTIAKVEHSPEMRKDLDELIATGMSEEKAVELLSD